MRALGINWLAVAAAAIAIYAIGFVVYGLLVPEESWMAMTGMTDAEKSVAMSRMAFGPLMPVLTAAFLALILRWARVEGAAKGAQLAVLVALASAIPAMLYGWVYGGHSTAMTAIDSAHLMIGHVVAGAIIGGWR